MYSYIIGKVTEYDKNCIILENNNIGYLINVANPYSFKIGDIIKIYLFNNIKEDENSLFGFETKEEKDLFMKLINVKGIGPRTALPMFTGDINKLLNAINNDDVTYLSKFPKIGEKAAKQIILDLKGKLTKNKTEESTNSNELVEVLESLGYKSLDIKKVLPKINSNLEIENQIKEALKLLGK